MDEVKNNIYYLIALSIITFVGFYSFYVSYQISNFHPVINSSSYIDNFSSSLHPENEILIYQTGWLLLFIFVPLIYFFYRKSLEFIPKSIRSSVCGVLIRLLVTATIFLIFILLKAAQIPLFLILVSYCLYFILAGLSCYILSLKKPLILVYLQKTIDLIVGTLFIIFNFYLLKSLFSDQFEKALVGEFYKYNFVYLDRLPFSEIGIVVFVLLFFLFFGEKMNNSLQDLLTIPINRIIFTLSIILLIGFTIFLFGLPKEYLFNYVAMIGPLNDVVGGKTILVNSFSLYGLLNIYSLVPIFKIIKLSYENFVYVVGATYLLFYSVIFLIMERWFKSTATALLLLIFIIVEHYFTVEGSPLCCANRSFIRFGWWVILASWIMWQRYISISAFKLRVIEFFLIGYAVFWSFDTGLPILLSYIAYLVIQFWNYNSSVKANLIKLAVQFFGLISTIIIFFISITLFLYFSSNQFPDWLEYFVPSRSFIDGLDMIRLPIFGPYLLFMAILLTSIWYIFSEVFSKIATRKRGSKNNLSLFIFLTFYSLFSLTYYLGRSAGGNLIIIMIPFILICFWLLLRFRSYISNRYSVFSIPSLYAIFSFSTFMIIVTAIILTAGFRNLRNKFINWKYAQKPQGIEEFSGFKQTLKAINKELNDIPIGSRKIAIISSFDTEYLVRTGSVNVIDSNALTSFFHKDQIIKLGNQIIERRPKVIFAESVSSSSLVTQLMNDYVVKEYRFAENVGNLSRWERK